MSTKSRLEKLEKNFEPHGPRVLIRFFVSDEYKGKLPPGYYRESELPIIEPGTTDVVFNLNFGDPPPSDGTENNESKDYN